jgi:methyl-accepting chemotaxis protein
VIQQNASAAEEMASTTEELTGQSEQLVSALSFFRTGDEAGASTHRPGTKPSKPRPSVAQSNPKPHEHGPAASARQGVALRMKDRQDDLDGEFERY